MIEEGSGGSGVQKRKRGHFGAWLVAGIAMGAVFIFTILFVLLDSVSGGVIIDWLFWLGQTLPYLVVQQKALVFIVGLLLVLTPVLLVAILVYRMSERRAEEKANEKLQVVLDSIDTVFKKGEAMVKLPAEFLDTENKLNAIRNENIRNEQLAKEAEQRKNDLVVYLAHDLKTPLTSVIGYLTLLRDEPQISGELRAKYLEIALGKAQRLEDLINEFFDITRFNLQNIHLEKSEIPLDVMLQQLADEFYPTLSSQNLCCEVTAQPGVIVLADPDKLARVFDNLLRNAAAYSSPETTIRVGMRRIEGGRAVVVFENRGQVIPPHKLNTIFEKFYRLDSARSSRTGGAGLGLAIAKEIVELHGGEIRVTSDEEATRFFVILPAEPEKAPEVP